jgi:hypothetical protein
MTSPFLDPLPTPRPMTAPGLTVELREAIAGWFAARDVMPNSAAILAALADLAAEQISANPTLHAQIGVFTALVRDIDAIVAAANRRRMGGLECELVVKQ